MLCNQFKCSWFCFIPPILLPELLIAMAAEQYKWLERDLENVDRSITPWLVVTWHPPWYSSYEAHYREAECMRVEMEDLLYAYGVDIIFNGHVSHPNSYVLSIKMVIIHFGLFSYILGTIIVMRKMWKKKFYSNGEGMFNYIFWVRPGIYAFVKSFSCFCMAAYNN